MNTNRLAVLGSAALVVSALITSSASAALLTTGITAFATPGAAPAGGSNLASATSPFASAGWSGDLKVTVVSGDINNPLGGLTFIYDINNAAGPNAIHRLTISGFNGTATDVSYLNGSGTVSPYAVDRVNPDTIGFSFVQQSLGGDGPLGPGLVSDTLIIRTNSPDYRGVPAVVINGSIASLTTIGPVVAPEPATLTALSASLALAFRRKRR